LPENELQNNSSHLPTGEHDAGYSGRLWLPSRVPHENNHQLGFLVSFLVPSYVVYSAANVLAPSLRLKPVARHVSFVLSPVEEPFAQVLTEEILTIFPGYEPMPPELGNVPVPDVVDGIRSMGSKTLYHCLFTDTW
jgi:hypothetical protein